MLLGLIAATVATLGLLVNGNIRYQVGVGRVSGYSVAETFSHRPIVFRLASAAQAWLPERASELIAPRGDWWRVWTFEVGFRSVAALLAAGAAVLLWRGLRTRWGSAAWPYAVAAYAALVFTAPATGEPDWMAAPPTAFAFAYQGQYFVYHSIGFVVLSALLAVRTIDRSRAALRWPSLAWSAWTLVLFCQPARLRVDHPSRLYLPNRRGGPGLRRLGSGSPCAAVRR